jgi:hypothetical protein
VITKIQNNIINKSVAVNIFSRVLYKTTFANKKGGQFILSIDLLKAEIKKDLLCLTSTKLESFFQSFLKKGQRNSSFKYYRKQLFLKILYEICEEFLNKQYGCKLKVNFKTLKNELYTVHLLKDLEILFQVPFSGLIDPKDPQFLSIYYPVYSKASEPFIEALLDNLIIEISNCVVYFTVINFSSIYLFRQTIYRSKFLSLRNLERFKNNLNWQLYFKVYVQRPLNLYNNRHDLYVFKTTGIYCRVIYANRSNEIASLKNLPLLVIVLIEFGDFVTSRVDETIFIITKSLRFTLTSVLGQFICLIWRGIIEGLKK